MFKLHRDRRFFYIEDDNFGPSKMTMEELRELLTPQAPNTKLPISLVVIELVNGMQIAEIFKALGVDHVVTFTCNRNFDEIKSMSLAA